MVAALTVAAVLVHAGIDNPAALAVSDGQRHRASALVTQLGDRQFTIRDAAARDLGAMGRLALAAVREGQKSSDAEVRLRCGRLLPAMEIAELAVRLQVFVADTTGRYEHQIPGWELFRAATGDSRAARNLFAEISRNQGNWPLLAALRGPGVDVRTGLLAAAGGPGAWADRPLPARAAQAGAVRRWEFLVAREAPELVIDDDRPPPRRPPPSVPDVALVVLAETLHSERLAVKSKLMPPDFVNSFFNTGPGRQALEGKGKYGAGFVGLGRTWMETRDGAGVLHAYSLAKHTGRDPATICRYAARVLYRRELVSADMRVECLLRLAKENATEHLGAVLAEFTDDESVGLTQIRDYALAFAVRLTGQRLDAYGITVGDPAGLFSLPKGTKPEKIGEVVADLRREAFSRWRTWEVERFGAAAGAGVVVGTRSGH